MEKQKNQNTPKPFIQKLCENKLNLTLSLYNKINLIR